MEFDMKSTQNNLYLLFSLKYLQNLSGSAGIFVLLGPCSLLKGGVGVGVGWLVDGEILRGVTYFGKSPRGSLILAAPILEKPAKHIFLHISHKNKIKIWKKI